MNSPIFKFSWRVMLLHFVALWLFFIAFRVFAFFLDYRFLSNLYMVKVVHEGGDRLARDLYRINYAGFVGILIAFLLSLMATISRGWSWLNSVVSFTIIFLLCLFKITSSRLIPYFYMDVKINSLILFYPPLAVLMLVLALVLLYSGFAAKFVDRGFKIRKPSQKEKALV